jgi:hypothetical protein
MRKLGFESTDTGTGMGVFELVAASGIHRHN